MEAVIRKFRTALTGFNRQDVQDYIEQLVAAHRRELSGLKEQLEQAERRGRELEDALSGAEQAKSGAAAEEARVRACLEESTRSLSRLRGELSQTESKLVVARRELERLQTQVGELEPMADSYAQLKDRVATVELDAHRRAQDTVEQARAEAERVRAETREWLKGALAQYGRLRQGMDGLLEQLRLLNRDAEGLNELDAAAQALRERGGLE